MAIQWGLLANLAKTYGDNYDSGRKAGIEDAKVSALADLASRYQDGNIPAGEIGRALLRSGDSSGALAAAQLDLANRRDARDFDFRKEEAVRAQQNADRGYGLQERGLTTSERNADRTYDAGRTDAANTLRLHERELDVRGQERRDSALRSGWQVAPDGRSLAPVPGGPHDPATIAKQEAAKQEAKEVPSVNPLHARGGDGKVPEYAAKSMGFASRMLRAEEQLRPVEQALTGAGGQILESVGGNAGNFLQSESRQLARQAAENFVNSQLRDESGAAIGTQEGQKAFRQYFPQPGDSPAVIEQKRINRADAIKSMIYKAGPTYQPEKFFDGKGNVVPYAPPGKSSEAKEEKFSVGAAHGDAPKPGTVIEKPADIPVGAVVRRNGQVFRQTENGLQYLGPSGGGSQ